MLQTDPEADCKENTGVDCMGKWKLGLLSVFILFAFVAFVCTLRLLFDISPHLVVVLGLVAFLESAFATCGSHGRYLEDVSKA